MSSRAVYRAIDYNDFAAAAHFNAFHRARARLYSLLRAIIDDIITQGLLYFTFPWRGLLIDAAFRLISD
jgi:hypothetical protein